MFFFNKFMATRTRSRSKMFAIDDYQIYIGKSDYNATYLMIINSLDDVHHKK